MTWQNVPSHADRKLYAAQYTELVRVEQLDSWAVIVIGLLRMGLATVAEMTIAMGLHPPPVNPNAAPYEQGLQQARVRRAEPMRRHFSKYARMVLRSRNKIIREARESGLPRACAVFLTGGKTVRCRKCGQLCDLVPCVRCGIAEDIRELPPEDDVPLATPARQTVARPGTREKIAVMQARLERGESCFHEDDPRIEFEYISGSRPDSVSIFVPEPESEE